jgi:hypothetical protein
VARKYAQQKFSGVSNHSLHCLWEFNAEDVRALLPGEEDLPSNAEERSSSNAIIRDLFHSYDERASYMLVMKNRG